MKYLTTIITLTLILSCQKPDGKKLEIGEDYMTNRYMTATYGGCEYICHKSDTSVPPVHKGNCKNHKNNQQ